MIKKIFLVTVSIAFPCALQAQGSALTVPGQWEYADATQQATGEGLRLCIRADEQAAKQSSLLGRVEGRLCVSNPEDAPELLGFPVPDKKPDCAHRAKGNASFVLSELAILPEDEMYPERLEARLISVGENRITQPLETSCFDWTTGEDVIQGISFDGFKSIHDAIDALKSHASYADLSLSDFIRVDSASGRAELDASTQMLLPSGSSDTLVFYYEGNSGLHELSVHRYDGRAWSNISLDVLPEYTEDVSHLRGTSYFLDSSDGQVKVRDVETKRAWHYNGTRFVPEN